MPLETATYLTDLVATNPAHTDGLSAADSHMRLLKSTIKATFPNFTSAALSATQAQLDAVAVTKQFSAQAGSSVAPSISFTGDLTAGFYKGARTGQTAIAGRLTGQGAIPAGALMHFAVAPPGYSSTGTAGAQWLECNGNIYAVSAFPDLAAALGTLYGGDGVTSFGVPNLNGTGRFLRSWVSGTISIGVYQANQNASHNHTASADTQGLHAHNASVTDPGHLHSSSVAATTANFQPNAGGSPALTGNAATSTGTSLTGLSVGIDFQGNHSHNISIGVQGGSECRPEAMTCFICIKT